MNEHEPPTDLEDRLIDRALSEALGGEAPPDLSERILAAAHEQPSSTPAAGELAMNNAQPTSRSQWKRRGVFAVAASLFVAVGLMVLTGQVDLTRLAEVEQPAQPAKSPTAGTQIAPAPAEATNSIGLRGSINDAYSLPPATDELQMMVKPKVIAEAEPELGKTIAPSSGRRFASAGRPLDGEANRSSVLSSLEDIPATPGIIVEGEERLGIREPRVIEQRRRAGGRYDVRGGVVAGTMVASSEQKTREPFFGERFNRHQQFTNLGEAHRSKRDESGRGPGDSGDQYTRIYENPFIETEGERAISTFSIDVDTASYANVRQFLMLSRQLPPPDAVRLEELINYFDYDYSGPTGEVPFAAHVEVAGCPWQPQHRVVRVGIKGREIERNQRPQSNLVFLIDVSGSMNRPVKLPLLVEGMKLLTRQLSENDRVAIVVYASSEGLALPSTGGDQQATILAALEKLRAGGSTAGGAGIELAYQVAQDNYIKGGVNRVILCTDGDFNVGVTSTGELERIAEEKAKNTGVFLTVLGFGRGNLNDAMMETISGKGNGNYHYVDNLTEARKVLVEEMAGTLVTIAKDVKIQIEFNPAQVAGYRLLGYENRMLRTEDFNDDKKDAGEIGAGHTVTALYEIVPAGKPVDAPGVEPLKYQRTAKPASDEAVSDELLTLRIRYKQPDGDTSTKLEFPITDQGGSFAEATGDFQFASAVASFGMLLRNSKYQGNASYDAVLEIAEDGAKRDPHGYRAEFLQLVQRAKQLVGQ